MRESCFIDARRKVDSVLLCCIICIICSGCSEVASVPLIEETKQVAVRSTIHGELEELVPSCELSLEGWKVVRLSLMKSRPAQEVLKWAAIGQIQITTNAGEKLELRLYVMDEPLTDSGRVAYKCISQDKSDSAYFEYGTVKDLRIAILGACKNKLRTGASISVGSD
jgi:hypothetical protein